jgi:ferredoxin--NADP+ reductase/benzoate/toluate 1,2-dioxygenase reductase subunit
MDNNPLHPENQSGRNNVVRSKQSAQPDFESLFLRKIYRLHQVRILTDSTYVLRFDRNNMRFRAGQHITLGIPGNNQVREYSIYSTEQDTALEVLIREVEEGKVSRQLKKMIPGELLEVDGPFGFFTLEEKTSPGKLLFIATGTGIAPFHSMIGSNPGLNYTLVHGVRYVHEAYEREVYSADRYVLCTTRDIKGNFSGRVTDYLKQNEVDFNTMVYLCGNCDMIYEVYDLLTSHGFPSGNIKTEVYF